jgi:predicted cobalt transporter CbtA
VRTTYSAVISRALVVGLVAGLALAAYLYVVVEPVIDDAIALEERLAAADHTHAEGEAAGHTHGDEAALFTRDEQVVGGAAASVIYAVVMAAVFATVLAALRHRLPGRTDLVRTVWLGTVAFGAVSLVPWLKYPANPPAVGDPDTVNERTVQYVAAVVLSVVLVVALTRLSGVLRRRLADADRVAVVALATVVAFGLLLVLLPASPDEISPDVPAGLVWDFRVRSIVGLGLYWAGLAVGLGWLLERMGAADRAPAPEPVRAAA